MSEIIRIGYNAGFGFGLGLSVALALGLAIWGTLSVLATWAGKRIGQAIFKWKMKREVGPIQEPAPELKPEPKPEPKVFTVPTESWKAELNKPLRVGAILFKPTSINQDGKLDKRWDESITITYESDQGSLAALTVKLTEDELMSLKQ